MIECKKVSFSYPPNETDIGDRKGHGTLRNIDLSINDGDFVLLCGTSGCGKTTLTRLFNGLIPHYYDGKLEGTVMLDGEDMSGLSLFDISKKVGSVFQNPRSQFFNVDTTSEIAFGCENHGLEEAEIRKRVKLVSEQLNLTNLLDRSVFSLSGGEKQKIACGSAAAVEPDVFVLDEPSSNLDAYSIADFRKLLKILKSQGKTIIIAEHRLYYLYDLADRIIYLSDGEIQGDYTLPEFQLIPAAEKAKMGLRPLGLGEFADIEPASLHSGQGIWKLNHFHFAYKKQPETLSLENIELPAGNVTAVIGHNGAGKTTLSRCLCGLVVVVNDEVVGIITDGDVRRAMESSQNRFFSLTVNDIMTKNPKVVTPETKISTIDNILQKNKIHAVLVVDDKNRLVGIVDSFSIML